MAHIRFQHGEDITRKRVKMKNEGDTRRKDDNRNNNKEKKRKKNRLVAALSWQKSIKCHYNTTSLLPPSFHHPAQAKQLAQRKFSGKGVVAVSKAIYLFPTPSRFILPTSPEIQFSSRHFF